MADQFSGPSSSSSSSSSSSAPPLNRASSGAISTNIAPEVFPTEGVIGARRRRTGARALLDAYRNLAGSKQASEDPKDIDSGAFDGTAHFTNLVQTVTLKELIATESQMKKEVRNLDSEMKSLVHLNYHKFISATVTIRAIHEQVGDVEAEMSRLNAAVKRIDGCHGQMEEKLNPRREKIKELHAVSRLLRKRQFLFEMPSRLTRALELESYATAVSYYQNTSAILRKYSNIPSFQSILTDCDAIMGQLRDRLRARLEDRNAEPSAIGEGCDLLLKLEEAPASLRQRYLQGREKALMEQLGKAEANAGSSPIVAWTSELNISFLSSLILVVQTYQSLFPAAGDQGDLEAFGKRVFARFFTVVRVRFDQASSRSDEILKGIEVLHRQLQQTHAFMPASVGVSDLTTNVIFRTVGNHIEREFTQTSGALAEAVVKLAEQPAETTPAQTVERIVQQIVVPLQNVKGFVSVEAAAGSTFLARHKQNFLVKIGLKVQQVFLLIGDIASDYYPLPNSDSDPPRKAQSTASLLALSKLLHLLRGPTGLEVVQAALSNLALDDKQSSAERHMNPSEVSERLKQGTRYCLCYYARLEGNRLSKLIRSPIESADWMGDHNKAPRTVRANVKHVVEMLLELRTQLSQHYPSSSSAVTISAPSSRSKSRSQIDILFTSKKLNNPSSIDFDAPSILTAIVNILLKTFLEAVRHQTFNKHSFQQFQVDIFFLRIHVQQIVVDPTLADAMLNLVLSSTADRCSEPIALQHKIIEKIARQEYESNK